MLVTSSGFMLSDELAEILGQRNPGFVVEGEYVVKRYYLYDKERCASINTDKTSILKLSWRLLIDTKISNIDL